MVWSQELTGSVLLFFCWLWSACLIPDAHHPCSCRLLIFVSRNHQTAEGSKHWNTHQPTRSLRTFHSGVASILYYQGFSSIFFWRSTLWRNSSTYRRNSIDKFGNTLQARGSHGCVTTILAVRSRGAKASLLHGPMSLISGSSAPSFSSLSLLFVLSLKTLLFSRPSLKFQVREMRSFITKTGR